MIVTRCIARMNANHNILCYSNHTPNITARRPNITLRDDMSSGDGGVRVLQEHFRTWRLHTHTFLDWPTIQPQIKELTRFIRSNFSSRALHSSCELQSEPLTKFITRSYSLTFRQQKSSYITKCCWYMLWPKNIICVSGNPIANRGDCNNKLTISFLDHYI